MSETNATPTIEDRRPAAKRAAVTETKSITELEEIYDELAEKCTAAVAEGNKPEAAKLMAAKLKAHTAWYNAKVAERHEKRDAAKANGATPGVK